MLWMKYELRSMQRNAMQTALKKGKVDHSIAKLILLKKSIQGSEGPKRSLMGSRLINHKYSPTLCKKLADSTTEMWVREEIKLLDSSLAALDRYYLVHTPIYRVWNQQLEKNHMWGRQAASGQDQMQF